MSDTPTPPTPAPEPVTPKAPADRNPFNKAQQADLKAAGEILAAANDPDHSAALAKQGITPEWLTAFAGKITIANGLTTKAVEARESTAEDTDEIIKTRGSLTALLQDVQKAAKQKQRMWETDDDPTTNFSADGYLIGKRLNPNVEGFLANSRTLLSKTQSDDLPGIAAVEVAALQAAIAAHEKALADRPAGREDSSKTTAERDGLINQINSRRIALQHAADRAYLPGDSRTAAARTRFHLDPDRNFGG